jgi:hypothetical protein
LDLKNFSKTGNSKCEGLKARRWIIIGNERNLVQPPQRNVVGANSRAVMMAGKTQREDQFTKHPMNF